MSYVLAALCPGCRVAVEPDRVKNNRRYFTHDCETTPAWELPYAPPAPRMNVSGRLAALKTIDDGPIKDKDWEVAWAQLCALGTAGRSERWLDAIDWLSRAWSDPANDRQWVVLQGRVFLGIANAPKRR
ncbi:hypothetical protein ACFOY2_46125 [Nonomuraea purpurea]|uniref:Uncharacterized protein n=1 Tax=Nonomuraea purpurea TaxID=1849276 RepID=A0ABV8GL35_9ACTN